MSYAKRIFKNYFKWASDTWNMDNDTEIEEAIDAIVKEAVNQSLTALRKELRELDVDALLAWQQEVSQDLYK